MRARMIPIDKLTGEQRAPLDWLADSRPGAILRVSAVAGSGKTTTLKAIGSQRRDLLYLAYNRQLADDLKSTDVFAPQSVRTFHALAYSSVRDALGSDFRLERLTAGIVHETLNLKPMTLVNPVDGLPSWSYDFTGRSVAYFLLQALSRFCHSDSKYPMQGHFNPLDITGRAVARDSIHPDFIAAWRRYLPRLLEDLRKLWALISEPPYSLPFTFDTYLKAFQLYPERFPPPARRLGVLLVDEFQDLNAVQHAILRNLTQAHPESRVVVVGDRHQRIYTWRGALDPEREFSGADQARLTQTFRFGPELADLATQWVREFSGDADFVMQGNPQIKTHIGATSSPNAVLFRSNAAVFEGVMSAALRGERTRVPLAKALIDNLSCLRALYEGARPRGRFAGDYRAFQDWDDLREHALKLDSGLNLQIEMIEKFDFDFDAIERVLKTSSNTGTMLTTAHSAKGLEFGRVLLGDFPDLRDKRSPTEPDAYAEEGRLRYVAMTRAQECLDPTGAPDVADLAERLRANKGDDKAGQECVGASPNSRDALDPSTQEMNP